MLPNLTFKVHIAFNLLTTSNNIIYINVACYFFDKDLKPYRVFLAILNIYSNDRGENKDKTVSSTYNKNFLKVKFEYFIILCHYKATVEKKQIP